MFDVGDLNPKSDGFATQFMDRLLASAIDSGASDVHVEQRAAKESTTQLGGTIRVCFRVCGALIDLGCFPDGEKSKVLGRIKALARLVSYRADIPQEGRLVLADANGVRQLEARVGTLPTLQGERAVIRLASRNTHAWLPTQLGWPKEIESAFLEGLQRPSGVLLITGPAGAGKTTAAYAGLRSLAKEASQTQGSANQLGISTRSLVTLEDPIEAELAGVSQSQINPAAGFQWQDGLKALLRQDPEVMLVGEIRDPETAFIVFQAAMTGQLVITTMHARSAVDALRRLLDMGIPAHHLRSSLELLICQRLLRKNCAACRASGVAESGANECSACHGTGIDERMLLAELLPAVEGDLARAVLQDSDSQELQRVAERAGMQSLAQRAAECVRAGTVDALEVKRHFGIGAQ